MEQLNPGGGGDNTNAAPTPARRLPFSVGWETPLTGTYSVSSISHSTKSPSQRSAAAAAQPPAKRAKRTPNALWSHICDLFFFELRVSLISSQIFVRCQHLIARNDRELFSSNRVVSHLYEAHRIDDVSRGSLSCPKSYYFAR